MAGLGSITRQLPSVMAGIKLEQNASEKGIARMMSDFDSAVEENGAIEKNSDSFGELTQERVKQFDRVTSDRTGKNPDLAVLGTENLSVEPPSYTDMQARLHGSFSHPSQKSPHMLAAGSMGMRQSTPCQDLGDAVVIDGNRDLIHRWQQMGTDQGLHSNSQIATFLLDRYEESRTKTSECRQLCTSCHTPLTLVCLTCNLVQTKHEEDTSPAPVYGETESVHDAILGENSRGEEDDDDDVPLRTDTSDDSFLTTEAKSIVNEVPLEKEAEKFATAFSSSISEDSRTDEMVKKVALPHTVDQISQKCFVKVVDIASKQGVKILREDGLLTTGEVKTLKRSDDHEVKTLKRSDEVKTLKRSESKNNRRTALTMKIKLKRNKADSTSSVCVKKQAGTDRAVLYKEDKDRGEGVRVKRKRGRPRKEHVADMLENKDVDEKPFKCSVCCKAFRNHSNCRAHELSHAGGGKPHKCEHCPASFRSYANLRAHCRKHTGERPFSCETCGKSFARSTTLEQHKRIHTNDRPYKCGECGETFKQRGMVIVHRRKAHTFERPFSCNICGANFVVKGHLQVHMLSHTGLRPFLCEECGASFKQKGILKTHKMIHKGIRPYSCDICSKSFYRQVDVRAHKKTHFNIRNIICNVCGAAFGNNGTLKRHMQKHTGFRPFNCSECGKNFASNSELKVHQRIHSGHKPYICDVCERGFQTMGNMKKHRKNRHKNAPPYVPSKPKMGAQMQEDLRVNLYVSSVSNSGPFTSENNKAESLASEGQKTQPFSSGNF